MRWFSRHLCHRGLPAVCCPPSGLRWRLTGLCGQSWWRRGGGEGDCGREGGMAVVAIGSKNCPQLLSNLQKQTKQESLPRTNVHKHWNNKEWSKQPITESSSIFSYTFFLQIEQAKTQLLNYLSAKGISNPTFSLRPQNTMKQQLTQVGSELGPAAACPTCIYEAQNRPWTQNLYRVPGPVPGPVPWVGYPHIHNTTFNGTGLLWDDRVKNIWFMGREGPRDGGRE